MQTTPPMVMASAPKAGAVQPLTRKIAAVAISVAMVMPETGLAELPMSPTMRDATVTKRNPKIDDQQRSREVREQRGLRAGHGLEREEEEHQQHQRGRAERRRRSWADRDRCAASRSLAGALAELLRAGAQRADDGGHRPEQGDEAGCGDCARAHRPDVSRP